MPQQATRELEWPPLPLSSWQGTKDTLQLLTQMAGKVRLALSPPEPEWAHVALYVSARGLTTGPMAFQNRIFEIAFDFVAHQLTISVSDGTTRNIKLAPRPVADFYQTFLSELSAAGIDVSISPIPQELPDVTPFDQDTKHSSYDADSVHRCWQILAGVDTLLRRYRAPFRGRHTPVQVFWGGLDISYVRYSGRPAAPPPGAGLLYRVGMDAEEIYAGFWPGDARYPNPAFGSYVYPKPAGIEEAKIEPKTAHWDSQLGLFLFDYEEARTSRSPSSAILDFFSSCYVAGAKLARWDESLFTNP